MNVNGIIRALRRNWLIVAGSIVIALVIAGVFTTLAKPTYVATSELFVSLPRTDSAVELQQAGTFTQARVQTYAKSAQTAAVLDPVIDELDLDTTVTALADRVTATADPNTVIITLHASAETEEDAEQLTGAIADSLATTIEELENPSDEPTSPIKVTIVSPPDASSKPASPKPMLNLGAAGVLGLLLGLMLALLRDRMDSRIRHEDDLVDLVDVPVLGGVAFDPDVARRPLITEVPIQSPRSESFRHLRTNLQFAQIGNRDKAVLITSSLPGEGKTSTSLNLAIALAQSGLRVVLVEADLRRPRVSKHLGLDSSVGLTTVILGRIELTEAIQVWGREELHVLSSGRIPPNPAELLGSPEMAAVLERLNENYDVVIIDGPPLLPVTDSSVLAQAVGGVVLVASARGTKRQAVEKAISSLTLVNATLYGFVLNMGSPKSADSYSYSYDAELDDMDAENESEDRAVFTEQAAETSAHGAVKTQHHPAPAPAESPAPHSGEAIPAEFQDLNFTDDRALRHAANKDRTHRPGFDLADIRPRILSTSTHRITLSSESDAPTPGEDSAPPPHRSAVDEFDSMIFSEHADEQEGASRRRGRHVR